MYCRYCGKEIEGDASFCPYCGASQAPRQEGSAGGAQPVEESGVGWGILGFFVPLVGLILFLIWKDEHPARSKGAGIGALVSVCLGVVLGVLVWVFLPAILMSGLAATAALL